MDMALRGKLRQGFLFWVVALLWMGAPFQNLRAQTLGEPVPELLEDPLEGDVAPGLEPSVPSQGTTTSARTGSFRVGNRTPYPIRLVILMRGGERLINPETAHWDFAPGEGGSEGLVLSLGEEPLQISPGDIVVAFTLDGTRRYWGPNVVGESLAPFWNGESSSWSMILQP
ncbi:hypothetical protein L1047_05975 [Synechococcus sp. Nb3U1]|uniref:hypothetical protein n=1 Tax=Synechococcus sp. Nb3U1 TaxID=1914529 RepID=UPI001F3FA623|nr:hypothetical protein [Synechococcus sp. Nb3U1]MCF2970742.1 hypothetical protein [Synechococcus sp. Nb3U1]